MSSVGEPEHCGLTELPLAKSFSQWVAAAVADSPPFYVAIGNLDHLQRVNMNHGFFYADGLIKHAAQRLKCTLPASFKLARVRGDEFAIVALNANREELKVQLELAREAVSTVVVLQHPAHEPESYQIDISFGVAAYPSDRTSAEAVIESAREAMYLAKQKGRNQVCFFDTL
jgi:diguanylate cyclase (GGDEF)-like protein